MAMEALFQPPMTAGCLLRQTSHRNMQGSVDWKRAVLCLSFASIAVGLRQNVLMNHNVAFAGEWEVLGPFKLGTRGSQLHQMNRAWLTLSRGNLAV